MADITLPPEAFRALAAVAWVDDRLDPQELEAITRAAAAEGLTEAQVEALKASLATRSDLAAVDLADLSRTQGLYLYAMATWVATLRYGINEQERAVLNALRERLGMSTAEADALDQALCDLLLKPHAMRPARFDFAGLRAVIAEHVEAVKAFTPVKGTPAIKR